MFTIGQGWRRACAAAWIAIAAVVAGAARAETSGDAAPAEPPIVLAQPANLDAAVAAIEKETGARATRLHGRSSSVPPAEGRAFQLDSHTATRLIDGSRAAFQKAGLFLFRQERSFGLADEKDVVGVLAAADWRAAVRRIGTAGVGMTNDQVIASLDRIAKQEPFDVTEVGLDYVAGKFVHSPKDPAGLAREIAKIAPDLVRGHKDPIAGLTDLIGRERVLYLIWE